MLRNQLSSFLVEGLGARRKRVTRISLPSLLLRQPACGVGLEVCESLSRVQYRVARVQPLTGGIQARIFVDRPGNKDASKRTELPQEILWGGRWSIVQGGTTVA